MKAIGDYIDDFDNLIPFIGVSMILKKTTEHLEHFIIKRETSPLFRTNNVVLCI